jgi:hypothetical protein
MKRFGKIAICLAGGLALNAGLRAANLASTNNPLPDNPYAAIVVRNIFGLNPPPPPPDAAAEAEKNLPKITPTGIMTVFGHSQVLYKVTGIAAKPGQPVKDEFYILSQGQRQDDIEVMKIDEKNSLVTFNNHGTTQELPLANGPASGGAPTAVPSSGSGMNPGKTPVVPGGGGNNGTGGFTRFGAGPGGNNGGMANGTPGSNGGNAGNGANVGMNFDGSTQGRIYQPEASTMTPEQIVIWIEAQRAALMNNPHQPYSPALLPPTPLTKFNTPGGDEPPAP